MTKPSKEMRKAMSEAEVGDDVFKEDPTVNGVDSQVINILLNTFPSIELESHVANLLGKEAALLVSSGTMANLIAGQRINKSQIIMILIHTIFN